MPSDLYAQTISKASLATAWQRVRRGGQSPGLDGVSVPKFAWHEDRELARLREELREGTYRPWPARRVALPKADGSARLIGVQAVRDRVVQRALLRGLLPRVEPRLEDCSFAFRPGRSIESALTCLDGLRAQGYGWAVRADVLLCFDSLNRDLLEACLRPVVPEDDARHLVHLWLTAGVVDDADWSEPGVGVPQGDVLSPLLCNLYLDAFDEAMLRAGHPLVRYADDFVLVGRTEAQARQGLTRAVQSLHALGLRLNADKQWVGTWTQGFEYLGAALVGGLRLPLHRVERPRRPPHYDFAYEHSPPKRTRAASPSDDPPLLTTERVLRDRMVGLLRAERNGRAVPPVALALLRAWQEEGLVAAPSPKPSLLETWQSVYLI